MNKNIFLTLFAFFPILCFGQGKYTVHGEFPDNSIDGTFVQVRISNIFLEKFQFIDSALVINGKFHYEGDIIEEPFLAHIRYEKGDSVRPARSTSFIMEPGDIYIKVTDWEEFGNVSGTPINEDYNVYVERRKQFDRISNPWRLKQEEGFKNRTWTEDDQREYSQAVFRSSESKLERETRMQFMEKYAQYPGVIRDMLFSSGILDEGQQKDVQHILDKMPDAVKDTLFAYRDEFQRRRKEYRKKMRFDTITYFKPIEVVPKHLQVGQPYIDFVGKTQDGTKMKLSEILPGKKLILLDFWASWCGPCIKEMPIIAEIYEKYKDQGLALIGITCDVKELAWKDAIERYDMKWLQLTSVDGKDEIGKLYNVKSIPYTLIIDGNGTIVSRRLRGEELTAKIDELMTIE